ncbi:zinc finger protein 391-like isoform X2 [Bradysia coprophila]|uniref:zinc finger protein 391-like isoform X2 n=1 Tax=Bradysia coprophila TaxID=38358 RepID=UPI00187DBD67|nr:zinc finger protein 391-like isoform X2 [Bradysia coprophila]
MGNKANRAPRRKRLNNYKNLLRKINNTAVTENNKVSTDETVGRTVVVDVVSILNSVSDTEHKTSTLTTVTNVHDTQDPLFVIKSEEEPPLIFDKQLDELPIGDNSQGISNASAGSITTMLKIEPISSEAVIGDPSVPTEFKNMCRLCMVKDEGHWIEIFSKEPFDGCDEITPSNITEIIEQSTTVRISSNDNLPNKLCEQCFLSLRFVHKFREKSIRSQSSLSSMVNDSSQRLCKENEQDQVVVNTASSQPMKKLIKVIRLKPLPKSFLNAKRNPTTYRPARQIVNVEKDEKITGDVQYVKPFTCTEPFCDKSFYSPMNRKSHILNVHCIDPQFKCDICEKAYTKAEKLKIHRTIHFPPTIPCKICGKLLRSRSSVYKHQKSHTERMFHCDDCGKRFQNAYTLRVHRRVHTMEKPFICCKCGEAFAYNCLLKAHTERKHSD